MDLRYQDMDLIFESSSYDDGSGGIDNDWLIESHIAEDWSRISEDGYLTPGVLRKLSVIVRTFRGLFGRLQFLTT